MMKGKKDKKILCSSAIIPGASSGGSLESCDDTASPAVNAVVRKRGQHSVAAVLGRQLILV